MLKFPIRSAECGSEGLQFTVGSYKRAKQCFQDVSSPSRRSSLSPFAWEESSQSNHTFNTSIMSSSSQDEENEDSCTANLLIHLSSPAGGASAAAQQHEINNVPVLVAMPSNEPEVEHKWRIAIPSNNVDESTKRTYVLELTRRFSLTRRELSSRAGLQSEFRFMNYWLRGKELHNVAVLAAGAKLYEWAVSSDVRVAVPLSVEEKILLQNYQRQQHEQQFRQNIS